MFLREKPTETLAELREKLDHTGVVSDRVTGTQVRLDATSNSIRVKNREMVASAENLAVLSDWVEVPTPLTLRLPADLRAHLFNGLLDRRVGESIVRLSDSRLVSVREPGQNDIDPVQIVDVAARVIDPSALVSDWHAGTKMLTFDTIVPEGFDRGVGGDLAVGDISHAGLRFGQSYSGNLAPFVQPLIYRLICTNGMEIPDATLKVDARGKNEADVLAHLEAAARMAFSRIENDMTHFYAMRDEAVDNPERTIARLAREQRLPERTRVELIETVAELAPMDGHEGLTMFDIVNHVTNAANDPAIRPGAARKLQIVGGRTLVEHVARCRSCQSRLN